MIGLIDLLRTNQNYRNLSNGSLQSCLEVTGFVPENALEQQEFSRSGIGPKPVVFGDGCDELRSSMVAS